MIDSHKELFLLFGKFKVMKILSYKDSDQGGGDDYKEALLTDGNAINKDAHYRNMVVANLSQWPLK